MIKKNFPIVIALAFIAFSFIYYGILGQRPNANNAPDLSSPTPDSSWKTYRNEDFDFEIKYPNNWNVAETPDSQLGPIFNFYPKTTSGTPPFIHFSELNHVSVYPYGIPTEGINGEYRASFVNLNERPAQAIDFILEDETPWATYINFAQRPRSWQESGFIFAGTEIINPRMVCMRGEQPIEFEKCDPFSDDLIIRDGEIDKNIRQTQEIMLSTFKFLPQ